MRQVSKPVNPRSVTIKVTVHLDNGRSLVELLELEDIKQTEQIELHIWEDSAND